MMENWFCYIICFDYLFNFNDNYILLNVLEDNILLSYL